MTCVTGSTINKSVVVGDDSWHILIDVTDESCATGSFTLATILRDSPNRSTQTQQLTVGRAILHPCPGSVQPTLFAIFAQTKVTADQVVRNGIVDWTVTRFLIEPTVLVCTPGYKIQEAMVTTDIYGVLYEVDIRSGLRNPTISIWDLCSAVNHSLVAAGPVFLEGPTAYDLQTTSSIYDELFGVMISTLNRRPVEYLDPDTLIHDTQRLFNAVAN